MDLTSGWQLVILCLCWSTWLEKSTLCMGCSLTVGEFRLLFMTQVPYYGLGKRFTNWNTFLKVGPKFFSLSGWTTISFYRRSGLSSRCQASVLLFFLPKQIGSHVFFSKNSSTSRLQHIQFCTARTKIVSEIFFLEIWHLKIWDILLSLPPHPPAML